jgi:Domain of unknown function (DUF4372)/Transposase DDE domain
MNQSNNFSGQHIFSQVTKLCNRSELSEIISSTKADRYYKHLKCFEHFISMLYCVLSNCTSLREIVSGLGVAQGKLNHLGIDYVPPRSTLSDGNKNRPASVFKNIYQHLYQKYKPSLSDSTLPKAILQKLFLMDSTVFGLFKAILKTHGRYSDNGKRKGGIKKNTIIEGNSLMPCFIQFSAATDSDQQIYKVLSLPEGSYVVFDKGYNNYRQFAAFTASGIRFVTRLKEGAVYESEYTCLHDRSLSQGIVSEEIILLTYKDDNNKAAILRLRRILWWDDKYKVLYELATNDFMLDALTIARLYQYRWQIELFFKKLKQNFPLQYFVGDNQNAIEIQIWCALIALLLLSVLHHQHQSTIAFTVFVSVLRLHLFNYISLNELLHEYQSKRAKAMPRTGLSLFNSS